MSYRDRDQGQDWDARAGDEGREERIKQLILSAVTRCSECRRRYHLDDFAVIGHRDHLWMVTVVCEGCRSQGFITAIVEDPNQLSGDTAEARPVGRAPAPAVEPPDAGRGRPLRRRPPRRLPRILRPAGVPSQFIRPV